MNFRLQKNCVCQKLFWNTRYSGAGIKKEIGNELSVEELDNVSNAFETDEIIDARRMNSFRGSGSRFGSQKCGRHIGRP